MPLSISPRILLADRDRDRRVLIRRMLREIGIHEVVSSAGILGALEKLKTQKIDLVLASDDMDVWGGLEFARMVQASGHGAKQVLPVILMTRSRCVENDEHAKTDFGVAAKLVRPFFAHDLTSAIDTATA